MQEYENNDNSRITTLKSLIPLTIAKAWRLYEAVRVALEIEVLCHMRLAPPLHLNSYRHCYQGNSVDTLRCEQH